MSRYSGYCDLADFIGGMGGWFDKNGTPVTFGDKNVTCYYSDEMLDFLAFMKKTGGVIYQVKTINEVTSANRDLIAKYNNNFNIIEQTKLLVDKRIKRGHRTVKYYEYKYFDKIYKEGELKDVQITLPIKINSIMDIIQYYPYKVVVSACSEGKCTVIIASEVEEKRLFDTFLNNGYLSKAHYLHNEDLQRHYVEVVERYMLYNLADRTKLISIKNSDLKYDEKKDLYILEVPKPIDFNHDMIFTVDGSERTQCWTSPKYLGENKIGLCKIDGDNFKTNIDIDVKIKYIEMPEKGFPIYLN